METHFFVLLLLVGYVHSAKVPVQICKVFEHKNEEITIGGIFSIHGDLQTGNTVQACKRLLPVSALQLTEAMAFAVDAINRDNTLLPNNSLGFKIYDDCSRDEYAMWGSLSFHMSVRPKISGNICLIPGRGEGVAAIPMGIVGTGRSSSSEVVTTVAQLFKRPMVSYGATKVHLHQVGNPRFHFSTRSSDHHKARAIVDVLSHFKWEYIAVVHSSDEAVLELLGEVQRRVYERQLCMNVKAMVHEAPTQDELNIMVDTLRSNQNAQVVLLLASAATTVRAVLYAVSEVDPPFNRTWLVDSWGNELVRYGHSQNGISIEYNQPELVEFENYFRSRVSKNMTNHNNPWFEDFCKNPDICLDSSRRGFSKSLENLAPTIDAVFVLAHFLDKTIRECRTAPLNDCLRRCCREDTLLKTMQNVTFMGTRGNFKFINNSVTAHFIIKNMQEDQGVLKLVEVGCWDPVAQDLKQLKLNSTLIQWRDGLDGQPPRSSCKMECLPNQVIENHPADCCSGCRNCSGIVNGNKCTDCDKNKKPNENFTVCLDLDKKSITWDEPYAIVLISLTSFGLLLCGVTSYGMIRHRHHALIKATSRELSTVNIIGLAVAFVSVFPFLLPPTDGICGVAQSLYALSFTLMYAPLLLKVNRIYRIFESSSKTVKRPRFTGPISQLVIVAVLITIQLVILFITALTRPTTSDSVKTLTHYKAAESEQIHLEMFCNLDTRFVAPMFYNIALLLACCFYAYKARNVPGNFNEARFYVASVYITLMPIVAAVPMYVTASTAIVIGVSVTLIPITNGYVTLILVYISTLYAIIFNKVDKQGGKEQVVELSRMRLSYLDDKGCTSGGSGAVNKVHPMVTRVVSDERSPTNAGRLDQDGL